jgi:hypothetical protein
MVQILFVGHPPTYPMGNGALSPGIKRPGREADNLFPTSAEVYDLGLRGMTHTE